MVDGEDIGADFVRVDGKVGEHPPFFSNWFQTADLIGIWNEETIRFKEGTEKEGTKGHEVYAIYQNNKVVNSYVASSILEQFINENKEKVVLITKRPYILNGESNCL